MTRINCIPVQKLTYLHLLAEYRELPRTRKLHPRKVMPKTSEYKLGDGHVLFFADKGLYLINRHRELRNELKHRGVKINFDKDLDLSHWPGSAMNNWEPDTDAKIRSISRIINRLLMEK